MLLKSSQICKLYGINAHTLARWVERGYIKSVRVGETTKLLYVVNEPPSEGAENKPIVPTGIIYARVSTQAQRKHLQTQIEYLKERYPNHTVYSDIASGLNFKRNGLKKVLDLCLSGQVQQVCVTHKDRLCRFAFDLIEGILSRNGTEIHVESDDPTTATPSAESELAEDIISIITVFGARLYGARSGESRRRNKIAKKDQVVEGSGTEKDGWGRSTGIIQAEGTFERVPPFIQGQNVSHV
jgi:predicted site-specific integrase-resolvase